MAQLPIDMRGSNPRKGDAKGIQVECVLMEERTLLPGQSLSLPVKVSQRVAIGQSLMASTSNIEGIAIGLEGAATCPGDGTDKAFVYAHNVTEYGIDLPAQQPIAHGEVLGGHLYATVDGNSGDITHVEDGHPATRKHKFSSFKWLPLHRIKVIILFCGIGGVERGLRQAWDKFGLSFQVVLAIDCDEKVIKIHQETFPDIPVVQHRLGVSYEKTERVIAKYVPREEWWKTYWHASPSCVEGSTANILHQDVKRFSKLTKWVVILLRRARPGMWTLEQIPRIRRYIERMTPFVEVLQMRDYIASTADRKRLIAAKRPLKLDKLTEKEYRKKL